MKWLTTYKKEVERTEQLGIEYQTALDNIITEIKKDDNISPDRILDIADCIQYIKRNRKRWAAGTGNTPKLDDIKIRTKRNEFDCVSISGLTFKPTMIIMLGTVTKNVRGRETALNGLAVNINYSALDEKFGCFFITIGGEMVECFWNIPASVTSSLYSAKQWTTEKWIAIE